MAAGLSVALDDIAAACSRPTVMRMGFGRAHVMRRNHGQNIAKTDVWFEHHG